jgi:hypothetical protein
VHSAEKISTVPDSKPSRNIEPPLILARFVSSRLLPVPEGEVAAEGCKIDTIEGIQKALTDQLNKISTEDFSNVMKNLETRANLCITSNGSYLE